MASKPYLNFDVQLNEVDGSYEARVVASPNGQASQHFSLPFSALELELLILKIGQKRGGVRSLHLDGMDLPSVKKLGGSLYKSLFSGAVAERFRSSLAMAEMEGKGLRIRLNLSGAPTLINIPWELLFDADNNEYIGLSINTPIIRKLDLAKQSTIRQTIGALRILVMIASPTGYYPLDVENEWKRINTATEALQATGRLILERVEPSLAELQRTLRRGEYHVFHFIGHGGFDQQNNDGVLVLEDRDNKAHLISGQYLGALLRDGTTLQLVLLNACSGGRTSVTDPFAGVGQSLLQKGIPAVIAMQFEITDQAAITFSHEFYAALADGYPIDAAVAEARKMIYAEANPLEWATPVLYTSIDDGGSLVSESMGSANTSSLESHKEVTPPIQTPKPQNPSILPPANRSSLLGKFGWRTGLSLLGVAIIAAVVIYWRSPITGVAMTENPAWGVIYGSNDKIAGSGAEGDVTNATKAGLTNLVIYHNPSISTKFSFHIVATATDEAMGDQLLKQVQDVQKTEKFRGKRDIVNKVTNLSDWCPNPLRQTDAASHIAYIECAASPP